MALTYIPASLRQAVAERADDVCEYCLIACRDTFFGCHIDHIISEKHGGATELDNLASACAFCNQAKGSDIGSLDSSSGAFVRFFNPKADRWGDHFAINGLRIDPLTPIGRVTERILRFNIVDRLLERELLTSIDQYSPPEVSPRL